MLTLLIDEDSPTRTGLVADFLKGGIAALREFAKGDESVDVTIRTVTKSNSGTRLYDDTWTVEDTIYLGIGNGTAVPVCLATIDTSTLPAAEVTASVYQAASSTANEIYKIAFTDGTYGGLYSLSATVNSTTYPCGSISPLASVNQIVTALSNHPSLNSNNVSVWLVGADIYIEFNGTLSGTSPTLAVANLSLLAPVGVVGTIDINTAGMVALFSATTANQLNLELGVTRTRGASTLVLYQDTCIIHRSVVDPTTAVPTPSIGLDAYIAARAVLYDRAQSLTGTQQLSARDNIGLPLASAQEAWYYPHARNGTGSFGAFLLHLWRSYDGRTFTALADPTYAFPSPLFSDPSWRARAGKWWMLHTTDLASGVLPRFGLASSTNPQSLWTFESYIYLTGAPIPTVSGYPCTSVTSNAVSTGTKTFTTQSSLTWVATQRIKLVATLSTTNYMYGTVTSYSGTTLVVSVDVTVGSGTFTSWTIDMGIAHVWAPEWFEDDDSTLYLTVSALFANGQTYVFLATITDAQLLDIANYTPSWTQLCNPGSGGISYVHDQFFLKAAGYYWCIGYSEYDNRARLDRSTSLLSGWTAAYKSGSWLGASTREGYTLSYLGGTMWRIYACDDNGMAYIESSDDMATWGSWVSISSDGTHHQGTIFRMASIATLTRDSGGGSSSSSALTVGTTTISGATNGYILFNNAGVLGSAATTGDGSTVVLNAAPTFIASTKFRVLGDATKGFDLTTANANLSPSGNYFPWISLIGGSSEDFDISSGWSSGYTRLCTRKGLGIIIGDGHSSNGGSGHTTYLTPPASGTLRVSTDGSTVNGIVDAATFTGNAVTATTAAGLSATLAVTSGGTGRATSTTAYGLLAAGTTATGVQQTLPAGATTDILVGGGASALPAWTTATGTGAPVRATSPTLVTPDLGSATATSINSASATLGSVTVSGGSNSATPTTLVTIINPTAAIAGTQSASGALIQTGQGWKTTATAASQSVSFKQYVLPVQGATAPTGTLVWQSDINGGGYTDRLALSSSGHLTVGGNTYCGTFAAASSGHTAVSLGSSGFQTVSLCYNATTAMMILNPNGTGNYSTYRMNAQLNGSMSFFGVTSSYAAMGASGTAISFGTSDPTTALGVATGGSVTMTGTLAVTGNTTLGTGTAIKNVRHGVSGAMVAGAVTVTDTGCTANTRYFFTTFALGTVAVCGGPYYASTRTASTSFVITSLQATETSTVHWMAIEP